ncbi:MAG: hypothetical protein AAFV07_04280 [Bacteroidota bacterium]
MNWRLCIWIAINGLIGSALLIKSQAQQLPGPLPVMDIARYEIEDTIALRPGYPGYVHLQVPYAKPEIMNPGVIDMAMVGQIREVELVFTRYPEDFTAWRTDYDTLLGNRFKALYELLPGLADRRDIQYRLLLQKGLKTEAEAKTWFHGWRLHLEPDPGPRLDSLIEEFPDMKRVAKLAFNGPLPDSSIYKILERNPDWGRKLVVMDWTSSMYDNGGVLLNWYLQQASKGKDEISDVVLFNDGNQTPHGRKQIGRTGGIYQGKPQDVLGLIKLMGKVADAGLGGDPAENDIEALLKATTRLDSFDSVVLVPDRKSSIRDIRLLTRLEYPVHIVLFRLADIRDVGLGASGKYRRNHRVHPHYLTLASMTKGTLHTEEQDLTELYLVPVGGEVRIGDQFYIKKENGTFKSKR